MIVGEAREAVAVEVDGERVVGEAEGVDAHVELAAAEEEGVEDVALADVVLGREVLVGALPLADVRDLVEDEDALALALGGGLHDPEHLLAVLPLELLVEDDVLAGHEEGGREEVVGGGLCGVPCVAAQLPCFSSARLYFLRFLLSMSLRQSSFQPRKWLTLAPGCRRYFSKTHSICSFSHHITPQSSPSVSRHSRPASPRYTQLRKLVLKRMFCLGQGTSTAQSGNATS